MERERDAEDRLDAALSLHARQISQRQVTTFIHFYNLAKSINICTGSHETGYAV